MTENKQKTVISTSNNPSNNGTKPREKSGILTTRDLPSELPGYHVPVFKKKEEKKQ